MDTTITWTDERVEQLRKLWSQGFSASQVAAQLGGVTRNAVIGKVHRLGLSGRAKVASAPRPRKVRPQQTHVTRAPRHHMMRGNNALAPMAYFEVAHEPEPEFIADIIPIGQRCSLVELTEATCHWPIGDPGKPDFFFCGGISIPGMPYCAYHVRVAYQPPERRRDRRVAAKASR